MFLHFQQQSSLELEALRNENKLLSQNTAKLSSEVESLRHSLKLTTATLNEVLTESEHNAGITETDLLQKESELARVRAEDFLAIKSGHASNRMPVTSNQFSQAAEESLNQTGVSSSSSEYPNSTDYSASEANSDDSAKSRFPTTGSPTASFCCESEKDSAYNSLGSVSSLQHQEKYKTDPLLSFSPNQVQDVQNKDITQGKTVYNPCMNEHYSTHQRHAWHSDDNAPSFSSSRSVKISHLEMRNGTLLPPVDREQFFQTSSENLAPCNPEQFSEPAPRLKQLDVLAKDIEQFDPSRADYTIEDYLREVEGSLSDLPNATHREKTKLIWKTTSRSVRAFIESQPLSVRDNYFQLRKALVDEFSVFVDETSATISAIQIKHSRTEHPRDYFNRLKQAFFQGRNGPGLTEDHAFKSLFLHNLHPSVRTHVTLLARQGELSVCDIKRTAQAVWETVVRPSKPGEHLEVLKPHSSLHTFSKLQDSSTSSESPSEDKPHQSSRRRERARKWKEGQNRSKGGSHYQRQGNNQYRQERSEHSPNSEINTLWDIVTNLKGIIFNMSPSSSDCDNQLAPQPDRGGR